MKNIEYSSALRCPFGNQNCQMSLGTRIEVANQLDGKNYTPITIEKCKSCDLGATYPYVKTESIPEMYADRKSNDFQPDDIGLVSLVKKYIAKKDVEKILKKIKKNDFNSELNQVLDFGCGNGGYAIALNEVFKESKISACDFQTEKPLMLEGKHIDYFSMSDLSSYTGKFDLILCRHVLEHSDDPLNFIGKLASLLSPTGYIFIEVPNLRSPMKLILGSHFLSYYAPFHFYHYTKKSMQILLAESEMRIISEEVGEMPSIGRSLQSRWKRFPYFPLFIAGLILHPVEILITKITKEGVVLRYLVKKFN